MLTEALLSAVTESVFFHVLTQANAPEKLRRWLEQDEQKLAFQIALACTYTSFVRQYPHFVSALFDKQFLREKASSILARAFPWNNSANPVELAGVWADQLQLEDRAREQHIASVLPAVTDFLRFLRAELRDRGEFQLESVDGFLECISASVAQAVRTPDLLDDELKRAVSQATKYQVTVEVAKGLVIGDNATVTNIFQAYFDSNYATIEDLYIRPKIVFDRIRLNEFVGRQWLEADLDAFLNNNDRGAWLLVGEAGIGKTSFLAYLVRERGYLHFFAEQAPGDVNMPRALQSLAVQLISRFRLEPYAERDTLPQELSRYPDFLAARLESAAAQLGAGERLVIVLDALDEAGVGSNGNVIGLPYQLPPGVYLIMSQRSQPVPINIDPIPFRLNLKAEEFHNQQDIVVYLKRVVQIQSIVEQLYSRGYTTDEFVHILAERSGGNWMYLYYVVDEIRRGERTPLDLAKLPRGLAGYYAQYWSRWRAKPEWDKLYAPLLSALSASFEPIPVATLKRWAGVQDDNYTVLRLLREHWAAFLYEQSGEEDRYRPYHASFREFLRGDLRTDDFPPNIDGLLYELRKRTCEMHRRIALELFSNVQQNLTLLASDPYAHRYLSTHLNLAGDHNKLFALINNQLWYEAQMSIDPIGVAYLTDLTQAWLSAEDVDSRASQHSTSVPLLVREIYCALGTSSLYSLSADLPPTLLCALVRFGLWTPAHVLAATQQSLSSEAKSKILAGLAPYLPVSLLHEALAIAKSIKESDAQVMALTALSPHLPTSLLLAVLDTARTIGDIKARARALAQLAPHLPAPQRETVFQEVLDVTGTIENMKVRAELLAQLAPHLPAPQHETVLQEALNIIQADWIIELRMEVLLPLAHHLSGQILSTLSNMAQGIKNINPRLVRIVVLMPKILEVERITLLRQVLDTPLSALNIVESVSVLSSLAQYLPEAIHNAKLQDAFNIVRKDTVGQTRARALAQLAPHLPAPQRETALQEAFKILSNMVEVASRVEVSARLAPHLPAPQRETALQEALHATQMMRNIPHRVTILTQLAPHLPAPQRETAFQEVLDVTETIEDAKVRAELLAQLAPHLPAPQRETVLQEALNIIQADWIVQYKANALTLLASQLPSSLLTEVLKAAHAVKDLAYRAQLLAQLAPHLPAPQRETVLQEALDAALSIIGVEDRIEMLVTLASQLPSSLLTEVLKAAHAVKDLAYRAELLAQLAPHLPEPQRETVLQEALDTTLKIEYPDHRAFVLTIITPYLPNHLLSTVLDAARAFQDNRHQVKVIKALAPRLASLPCTTLYTLWRETLHVVAVRPRKELLEHLIALLPLVHRLGGPNTEPEVARTILDIGQRWP